MGDLHGGYDMSLELTGTVDLRNDLTEMADKLATSGGNGGRATRYILQQAAVPVLRQMMHNAATDPKMRSHKLHDGQARFLLRL